MANESKISDLLADGECLLVQAYRRGYKEGVASARARIVSSLSDLGDEGDAANQGQKPADRVPVNPKKNGAVIRSPHGTVRPIVMRILSENPGSTITEAQKTAARIDASVSALSIGGELRRLRGRFYHQQDQRWYLTEDGKREAANLAQQTRLTASFSQGEVRDASLASSPSG